MLTKLIVRCVHQVKPRSHDVSTHCQPKTVRCMYPPPRHHYIHSLLYLNRSYWLTRTLTLALLTKLKPWPKKQRDHPRGTSFHILSLFNTICYKSMNTSTQNFVRFVWRSLIKNRLYIKYTVQLVYQTYIKIHARH